jgi:cytochrome P450
MNKLLGNGDAYKPEDHKVVLKNDFGSTYLLICDPKMVMDLYPTQNKYIDKTGLVKQAFEDLFGESFVFSKTTDEWSRKRKACAHAFYRDRMEHMMEVLKEKLADMVTAWQNEIDESQDGQLTIDIAKVFERLFCRNIVHICFGEDVSTMQIDYDFVNPTQNPTFIRKSVDLATAIHEFNDQCVEEIFMKQFNPLYKVARKVTGIHNFTKFQQTIADNGHRMREAIMVYVQQRKRGERKS